MKDDVCPGHAPDTFEAAARPLMKYLAQHRHPHTSVVVTSNEAEMVEGVESVVTDAYLLD